MRNGRWPMVVHTYLKHGNVESTWDEIRDPVLAKKKRLNVCITWTMIHMTETWIGLLKSYLLQTII